MTTQSPAGANPRAAERTPRSLLLTGLGALALSLLVLAAMHISTNPVAGSFAYDVMAWVRDVATLVGAVLVAAAFTLRQVAGQ